MENKTKQKIIFGIVSQGFFAEFLSLQSRVHYQGFSATLETPAAF